MTSIPEGFIYSPSDMVNHPPISKSWEQLLVRGQKKITQLIAEMAGRWRDFGRKQACRIALDGHLGVDWPKLIPPLVRAFREKGLAASFWDAGQFLKKNNQLQEIVGRCLPEDPIFGRIYDGGLEDLFDKREIGSLVEVLEMLGQRADRFPPRESFHGQAYARVEPLPFQVVVFYGPGAAILPLRGSYDFIFYFDVTREEILKRVKNGLTRPLRNTREEPAVGATQKKSAKSKRTTDAAALPAYFGTRRLYYVDYPALDAHRRFLLPYADFYVDANDLREPKMIPCEVLRHLLAGMAHGPVKPKPSYDPSPWGGTWLKRVRRLPKKMVNCAWSYDFIEPEASFQIAYSDTILELPFAVLTGLTFHDLLGKKGTAPKFGGQVPIRVNYDDSLEGGDMALQAHPDDAYIHRKFDEPYRQDESYYVVDRGPGSKVHLGLTDEANVEEFRKAVERAEREHVPFDHTRFANAIPTKTGDLFLIPAGTLHGSGVNEVVLEISATTYRYTFHFYDFLRPGLDGKMRDIHSEHAFNALKTHRRAKWVGTNLKQKPRLVRQGKGWAEYLLGRRHDMFFKVHRLEFGGSIRDDTKGEFHIVVVVAGNGIRIRPRKHRAYETFLPFSCGALIPAATGPYALEGVGAGPYQVIKVLMA